MNCWQINDSVSYKIAFIYVHDTCVVQKSMKTYYAPHSLTFGYLLQMSPGLSLSLTRFSFFLDLSWADGGSGDWS